MFRIIKRIIAFFTKKKNIEKEQIYFVDSRPIYAGHKIFQYNWIDRTLVTVEMKRDLVTGKKRILMVKNCIYVSSASRKSAIKKLQAKGHKVKIID
jgi:hypothetical protein